MEEIEILKNNSEKSQPVDNFGNEGDNLALQQIKKLSTPIKGKNGGARPGAGRKKGGMNKKSIERMKIKKEFDDRVAKHAQRLFDAQISLAIGNQYLYRRTKIKTKKGWRWSPLELVTDPEEIAKYIDGEFKKDDNKYYQITVEKPDSHAIDSLLDRGFGKAPQNLNIKDDRPDPISIILAKFGLLEDGESSNDRQAPSASETTS